MRRFGVVLGATMLVLSIAPAALASSPRDFVAGGGQHLADGVGPTANVFSVSAHSVPGPAGAARGSVTLKVLDGGSQPIRASVTCMWMTTDWYGNNAALITGTITRPAAQAGKPLVVEVVDRGNPVDGASPDLVRFSWTNGIHPAEWYGGPAGCYFPLLPPVPLTAGNVVVNDAS